MRSLIRLAVPLGALAGLVLLPSTALACSCASTGSAREDARFILDNSDAAFIGVLKSVRRIDDGTPPGESAPLPRAVFRYRVRREYGAPLPHFVRIEASTSGANCGLPRRKGKYALGLVRRSGEWRSGLCALMRPRALRKVAAEGVKGRSAAADRRCNRRR